MMKEAVTHRLYDHIVSRGDTTRLFLSCYSDACNVNCGQMHHEQAMSVHQLQLAVIEHKPYHQSDLWRLEVTVGNKRYLDTPVALMTQIYGTMPTGEQRTMWTWDFWKRPEGPFDDFDKQPFGVNSDRPNASQVYAAYRLPPGHALWLEKDPFSVTVSGVPEGVRLFCGLSGILYRPLY
jgi:hypothetical protein